MATASSSWIGSAGAGGVDLRSDVVTTPTASMLAAIAASSLRDDVYKEDTTTNALQAHVAALAGKEAGLLVLSGTMGNQVALRALLTATPAAVLCDHRAHIFCYEAGGVSSLTGAMVQPVVPRNGLYLTLEDVEAHAVLGDDIHACPTRVISLENSLNGVIQPLAEMQRIAAWARAHGIRVHCDGARLWETAAATAEADTPDSRAAQLAAFSACCDTVSLCCSKGLGAPIGSVVVGPADVLQRATWARKAIGGGLRQAGVVAAAARVAVDETFLAGKLQPTHALARDVAQLWTAAGGKLLYPVETNMVWLDLATTGVDADQLTAAAAAEGLKIGACRLVLHYQVYDRRAETVPALTRVFAKVLAEAGAPSAKASKPAYPTA